MTIETFPPPPRPSRFRIFAAILDRAFGEFWCRLMYASTVKACIPGSHLTVYYRDDRSYKRQMVAMCPYVDSAVVQPADYGLLPLDWFYPAADRVRIPGDGEFIGSGYAAPDLLLVPTSMLERDMLRFDYTPRFVVPDRDAHAAALERMGLNRRGWFAVVHYREPTYPPRGPTPYRDVQSDEPYRELRDRIIGMGGQVVRIGHRQMREWPACDGFVDLSREDFPLQAAAISMARFCVMTQSGPQSIPAAFDVPSVATNASGLAASGAAPGLMLPRRILAPDGGEISTRALIEQDQWTDAGTRERVKRGCKLVDNTPDELHAAARVLHDMTDGVSGWREPGPMPPPPGHGYDPNGPYRRRVNVMGVA